MKMQNYRQFMTQTQRNSVTQTASAISSIMHQYIYTVISSHHPINDRYDEKRDPSKLSHLIFWTNKQCMVLIYNIGSGTEDHTWAATLIKALVCVSLPQCIKSTGVLDTGCAVSKRCTFVADLSQSQSMKHFVNMLRMPTAAQTSVRIIGTEDCSNLVCSKCNMVVEVHQTFCVHVQNAYDSSDECQNHWNWRLLKSCVLKMLHDCRSAWNILCTAQVQNTFDSSEKCQCHLNYWCLCLIWITAVFLLTSLAASLLYPTTSCHLEKVGIHKLTLYLLQRQHRAQN